MYLCAVIKGQSTRIYYLLSHQFPVQETMRMNYPKDSQQHSGRMKLDISLIPSTEFSLHVSVKADNGQS